ncbi:hypothetical protein M758_UG290300 [Ceratodon purpureus]|nr:hypothetical protein M758_UG290300 [Ceratodon purpureus]
MCRSSLSVSMCSGVRISRELRVCCRFALPWTSLDFANAIKLDLKLRNGFALPNSGCSGSISINEYPVERHGLATPVRIALLHIELNARQPTLESSPRHTSK